MEIDPSLSFRGLGLMWGIDMGAYPCGTTQQIRKVCFEHGLILELSGREDTVVKIMPPLVIEDELLVKGLDILMKVLAEVVKPLAMPPAKQPILSRPAV